MGVDASFADDERSAVHQPACYLRQLHPAHDIVGPDGRNSAGTRSTAEGRRHPARRPSVSLRPDRHCGCFTADPDSERFTERVGAIDEYADIDRADAVETLRSTLAEWVDATEGSWTDDELARAREHAKEKFDADEWIRRSPNRSGTVGGCGPATSPPTPQP